MKMGLEGISFPRHVRSEELEISEVISGRMWDAWYDFCEKSWCLREGWSEMKCYRRFI